MPRKTLYLLSAVCVLGFAVGLIFIPETFWGLFGGSVDPFGVWIGRLMTSNMLANIFLFWTLKDEPTSSKGAKMFSIGQVLAWGVMAIFLIFATLAAGLNFMAWATVGLGAVFAVLFALDGFKN